MRIDSHLHLPVKEGLSSLAAKRDCLLDELKSCKVNYGIVIPDNVENSEIGNLDECIDIFNGKFPIFLMAMINILSDNPTNTIKLKKLIKEKRVVALKIIPGHDPHFPNDERLIPYIDICIEFDIPFVIHTGWNSGNPEVAKWNDPKYIVDLASKYEKLKIIICHYFWPEIEYCYRITRGFANIYFDTSGLADKEVEDATGREKIKEIIEKTISDNPKSVLYGSDYGCCEMCTHTQFIENLNVSDGVKQRIFYKNAIDLFHLNIE